MKKSDVAALVNKQRKISQRGLGEQYENTKTCIEFYNGDTMSYNDRIQFTDNLGRKKRANVQFNTVQPQVDAVVGFAAQNRRQAKYTARVNAEEGEQLYSKYMNALHGYVRSNANADPLESDIDADMVINGYGAIESDISYIMGNATTDPNGEIIKERLDPMLVGWDPAAKQRNLLDSKWAYYYDDYSLKDALDLFQGSTEDDFAVAQEDGSDSEDSYQYNPYGGVYTRIKQDDSAEWVEKENEKVRVYNHQWFEYETFYRALNPIYEAQTPEDAAFYMARLEVLTAENNEIGPDNLDAGEMFDIDIKAETLTLNEKQKKMLVEEFGDMVNPIPLKRKCFYTAVYSGRHVFSFFKSISQQGFSIKFKTGTYNASKKIWTGMVNAMMDPAKYHNKALTELMFTIASNSKGGVYVETEAVEDIANFEGKYAQTDAVIEVRTGALSQGMIQDKARPAIPTGLENIVALSEQAIRNNGVDPSFVGDIKEAQTSGIMYKRRIRQVISKMAKYFDSITLYQKEDARLCADLIRVWVENNNGQFVRITGDDFKDEFLMINEDSMAAEYDVSIQKAPQTPEDKEETATALGMFGDKLAATGNSQAANTFYAESLQYLPIDGDVRSRLTEALQPNQETVPVAVVEQLQQQLQQLQSAATQAQLEKLQADTQKTQTDAALNQAKMQSEQLKAGKTQADTVKTLEEASRTGYENDILKSGAYTDVNVSI